MNLPKREVINPLTKPKPMYLSVKKSEIQNSGTIPYDIAYTEFGIKEKKRLKKAALSEEILSLILIVNGNQNRVLPIRKNRYVAFFSKFAVAKDRVCYMEVIEDERNLELVISFGRVKVRSVKQ